MECDMTGGGKRWSTMRLVSVLAVSCMALVWGAVAGASVYTVALFPSASSPHREGFARVINRSDASGTVRITGIDDAGHERGPVELTLEARSVAHFNSTDLEKGNAGKGLSEGLGDGEGQWRLRVESELDIEVLSYVRTGDGFVTAMHEAVPIHALINLGFFNPGSNTSQVSRLRLVNPTEGEVRVTIQGLDDEGEWAPGGAVSVTLGPGEAREMSAQVLESGGEGVVGRLGDGSGKWRLYVSSHYSDAAVKVMNLLESPTGHLSNLSRGWLRLGDSSGELELSLFLSASDAEREGFVRLINHTDASQTVRITGIDDAGVESGPVVLTLAPLAATHFNSEDLEEGNAAKGVVGALGAGTGSWRLRLENAFGIEALAYVRTSDGFVTTMHEQVREGAMGHHVAFFNPGSNASQVSRLRLVNPGEDAVEVTITGRDDEGEPAPGGEVRLTIGPGRARELSARELERGGEGLAGGLGDGSGKWRLFVTADGAIEVMNLLRSPTGHLANLSASRWWEVPSSCTDAGVDIPDARLRRSLERALGKAADAPITPEEMRSLYTLELSGADIESVAGLQCAARLSTLDLGANRITDLVPLAGLMNLTWLSLASNPITDIGPLAGLTNLTDLSLVSNPITDIGPLAGLTDLTYLNLNGNPITDIGPLAGLTNLTWLDLGSTVPTFDQPGSLTQITDIGPLAGLTNLTWLFLASNQITDIGPLAGLTNLTRLRLQSNPITDIGPLAGLTNLTWLFLVSNQITDIGPLAGLTNLTTLYLEGIPIADIGPLAGLMNLTTLSLGSNRITDIGPLAGLTNLTELHLESNPITDIGLLAGLTNLTSLGLGSNRITDIGPLADLTNLIALRLWDNEITDIGPLTGLTNLAWLVLAYNEISDIAPLVANMGLGEGDRVYVQGNPLSDESRNVHVPALRARGVSVCCDV